ncbi:16070_t:CDS:2, partial [Racocetra fulgida]
SSAYSPLIENRSISSNQNLLNLDKLLSELNIEQDYFDDDYTWEKINSRLETIFGRNEKLKTEIENGKKDWETIAQNILNLKSGDGLPQDNLSLYPDLFNDKFDQNMPIFGDTIESIKNGYRMWKETEANMKILETRLNYFRICHFYKLLEAYISLYNLAIKETPHEHRFLNVEQKIQEGISLGVGTSKTAIRKWVRIRMLQILGVDTDKSEERIFKALLRINFILTNGISSKEELAIAGATRRFFESSTKLEFLAFLTKITGRDYFQEFEQLKGVANKLVKLISQNQVNQGPFRQESLNPQNIHQNLDMNPTDLINNLQEFGDNLETVLKNISEWENTDKSLEGISLGRNASFTSLRGYVRVQIKKALNLKTDRAEAGASRRFFEYLNDENFDSLLRIIMGENYVSFTVPKNFQDIET